MKNGKVANIKVSRKSLLLRWLEITKPFHKLPNQQLNVLWLLLYYYFEYQKDITNDIVLWKMVFDYDTKLKIRDELGIKDGNFQNVLTSLRKKNIITDNKIVNTYIPNLENDSSNFKVIFNFIIADDEQEA
jgi:hypothetical protein|tara:strand:- start:78 stop:470 length:393 start_codon:yes stop_codon:yes gene_type:complete